MGKRHVMKGIYPVIGRQKGAVFGFATVMPDVVVFIGIVCPSLRFSAQFEPNVFIARVVRDEIHQYFHVWKGKHIFSLGGRAKPWSLTSFVSLFNQLIEVVHCSE